MPDDPQSPKQDPAPSGLSAFWAELKRRKVMRVAITYAVVAWLIMQVAGLTFEGFGVPIWAFRFVVIMLWLFFPVALIIAWAFELTPDGIKTTKTAEAERGDAPVSKKQLRRRNWFAVIFAATVPTVIFGTLALFFYVRLGSIQPEQTPSEQRTFQAESELPEKSIAVLPLENMSPDPNNAFFADGVQEDILTNLSKVDELRVISRTSTQQYRETVKTMKQISSELEVRYLVEGSVRRAGDQVLITVQLIDTNVEQHIWAESYNEKLDDIFAIQAAVAKEIAGQLQAALSPEEIEKIEYRPTENQEAYDAYTQARQNFETSGHGQNVYDLLMKAVRLDPQFTEAWAFLAYDAIVQWNYRYRRAKEDYLETANHALAQAERLAPDSPWVLFARATYLTHHDSDRLAAIDVLLRAVSTDPNLYMARRELGILNLQAGRLSDAQYHLQIAILNDPLSRTANQWLLHTYERRGLWDEARSLIDRKMERMADRDHWQLLSAQSEYLRTGNIDALKNAWAKRLHRYDQQTDLWLAAQKRDYRRIIGLVDKLGNPMRTSMSSIRMIDSSILSVSYRGEIAKALAWYELGDLDQAGAVSDKFRLELEQRGDSSPEAESSRWSALAVCYALLEQSNHVEPAMEKAREANRNAGIRCYMITRVEMFCSIAYLVLGNQEKAIATLEELKKQECAQFLNRELDLWFIFDRLRGDPRFDALLED